MMRFLLMLSNISHHTIFKTLKYIFNLSIEKDIPDQLKITEVTPLSKKGEMR